MVLLLRAIPLSVVLLRTNILHHLFTMIGMEAMQLTARAAYLPASKMSKVLYAQADSMYLLPILVICGDILKTFPISYTTGAKIFVPHHTSAYF